MAALLYEQINTDLKSALKGGDAETVQILRFVVAQFQGREKDKQGKGMEPVLTDAEVLEILQKEVKKRKEAGTLFEQGGRADLAQKEKHEQEMIQKYLPAEMTVQEIEAIVKEIRDTGLTEFGAIMKEVVRRTAGRADGKLVSEIVKKSSMT